MNCPDSMKGLATSGKKSPYCCQTKNRWLSIGLKLVVVGIDPMKSNRFGEPVKIAPLPVVASALSVEFDMRN